MTEATMTPELWARAMEHPEEFEGTLGGTFAPLVSVTSPDEDGHRVVDFEGGRWSWFLEDGTQHSGLWGGFVRPRTRPKPTPEPDVAALVEALREENARLKQEIAAQTEASNRLVQSSAKLMEIFRRSSDRALAEEAAILARWDSQP